MTKAEFAENKVSYMSWNKIKMALLVIILTAPVLMIGCSSGRIYSNVIGDATYSFRYNKDYLINPPEPAATDGGTLHYGFTYQQGFIKVTPVLKPNGENMNTHLGKIISEMEASQSAYQFRVVNKTNLKIAGFPAESFSYTFMVVATASPLPYYGEFASFEYKDYFVDIHVLFPSAFSPEADDTIKIFDLLVQTFRIKENP